jgi:hypothetical protein
VHSCHAPCSCWTVSSILLQAEEMGQEIVAGQTQALQVVSEALEAGEEED